MQTKKSCCNGETCVGEIIFMIASSKRSLAALPYSGADLGIHPMSVLDGERRHYFVVTILSPLVFVTTIFRMFALFMGKFPP